MKSSPSLSQRLAAREEPDSAVVMRQEWDRLLFLHWEVSAEIVQAQLPEGLWVDTHEGKAYMGVVPFFMERVRPRFCPSVPGISWFLELNLRTYVHDAQGRPGVWFFSLDCNQWLAVKLARGLFHLPYQHAAMSASVREEEVLYRSKRAGDSEDQHYRYPATARAPKQAEPGTLEFFFLERYRLFSDKPNGSIYSGLVHHAPYQFETVEITDYSTRLFVLNGFEPPTTPPVSSLIAKKVSVRIHPLVKS